MCTDAERAAAMAARMGGPLVCAIHPDVRIVYGAPITLTGDVPRMYGCAICNKLQLEIAVVRILRLEHRERSDLSLLAETADRLAMCQATLRSVVRRYGHDQNETIQAARALCGE